MEFETSLGLNANFNHDIQWM